MDDIYQLWLISFYVDSLRRGAGSRPVPYQRVGKTQARRVKTLQGAKMYEQTQAFSYLKAVTRLPAFITCLDFHLSKSENPAEFLLKGRTTKSFRYLLIKS